MTNLELIGSARSLNLQINAKFREKKELLGKKISLRTSKLDRTKIQGGVSKDFTHIVDTLTDIEKCIIEDIDELIGLKEKVKKLVYDYADSTSRSILIDRYVNCLSWIKVAQHNGYSEQGVLKINKKFIEKIKSV